MQSLPQTKKEFKELVKDSIVIFEFVKISTGRERKMIGTFDPSKIPLHHHPKGTKQFRTPDDQVCIFDLEMGEWRSFDIDTLISVNQLLKVGRIEQMRLELLTELYSYEQIRYKTYKNRKRVGEIKSLLKLLGLG